MSYAAAESGARRSPVTLVELRAMKARREPIAVLTAYDATHAALIDAGGIEIALVGDSLGMVVQGHRSTLPVSIDAMVYHCAAVARGLERALLLADMPFGCYPDPARAFVAAHRLVAEGGAAAVKLEGAGPVLECIRYLVEREIPVCAHLGLTPQSVHRLGGYKVQGREAEAAERLQREAEAVSEAGATLLVLECVPAALATRITRAVPIPTIGIGAGVECDGQVLVLYDMLGMTPGKRPRFVRDFLAGAGSAAAAVANYVTAVRARSFPAAEESF
jgi:3-methyl-2-oxobutanoate hydroxymethyltransferase